MKSNYQSLRKVFKVPYSRQADEDYQTLLNLTSPPQKYFELDIPDHYHEDVQPNSFDFGLVDDKPIPLLKFDRLAGPLLVNGSVTDLRVKDKIIFIGSSKGTVLVINEVMQIIATLQLQPTAQSMSILNSVMHLGLGSSNAQPKTTFIQNLVNVTYEKRGSISQEFNQDLSVCCLTLSEDKEIIAIATNVGEVQIFKYGSSFQKIDSMLFQKPQKFMHFVYQAEEKGALRTIETQLHDHYEILTADEYGNISKTYISLFKMFDKRSIQYKVFQLYDLGQPSDQLQTVKKQWWEEKQAELRISSGWKKILYDVKHLRDPKNAVYQYICCLFETRFEVFKLHLGKKFIEKTQSFVEPHYQLSRPDTFYLLSRFNEINRDFQINSSDENSFITLGQGRLKDFQEHQRRSSIFKDLNLISSILLINWGSNFAHLTYEFQGENLRFNLGPFSLISQKVGQASNESGLLPTLINVEFLSDSIIMVLLSDFQVILLHCNDFMVSYDATLAFLKQQTKISKMNLQEISQYVIDGTAKKDFLTYHLKSPLQSQYEEPYKCLYFIDVQMGIIRGSLRTWQEYLEARQQQEKWALSIQESIHIIQRRIRFLTLIPQNQEELEAKIFQYSPQIAFAFVNKMIAQQNDNNYSQHVDTLAIFMEYLFYTQNWDFYFNVIRMKLVQNGHEDIFYMHLEEYIVLDSLVIIYQDLKRKQRTQLIRKLIKGLDPKRVDKNIIIKMCEEQQLYGHLIYACNENNDYITPIMKLLPFDIQPNEKVDTTAQGLITYVMMCLQRKKITGILIQDGIDYWSVIKNIVSYLYIKDHISIFLQIHPFQSLNANYLLFQPKIVDIIQSQNQYINIDLSTTQLGQAQLMLEDISQLQKFVLNKIFILIVTIYTEFMDQFPDRYEQVHLYMFIAKAALSRQFKLQRDFHFKVVKYLLDQYDRMIEIRERDLDLQKMPVEQVWYLINRFFIQQVDLYFEGGVEETFIYQLTHIAEYHYSIRNYSLLQCYLLNLNGETNLCFKKWVSLQNQQLQLLVFYWLENLCEQKDFNQLANDIVINGVKHLIKIDKKRTYEFVVNHLRSKQYMIIEQLDTDDSAIEFLNYLSHIFDTKQEDLVISDQTKVRYIKYMCQYKPKDVAQQLEHYNFPLTLCLDVCKQYHNFESCVYILGKLGDQKQSLEYLTLRFLLKLRKYLRIYLKEGKFPLKKSKKMDKIIQRIVQICVASQYDYEDTCGLWYLFLELFMSENKIELFTKSSVPQKVKVFLCKTLSKVIEAMSIYMKTTDFIQFFSTKYNQLPLMTLYETLTSAQGRQEYSIISLTLQRIIQYEESRTMKMIIRSGQFMDEAPVENVPDSVLQGNAMEHLKQFEKKRFLALLEISQAIEWNIY